MRRFGLAIGFLIWSVVAWGLPGDPVANATLGETTATLTRPAPGRTTCETTILTVHWDSDSSGNPITFKIGIGENGEVNVWDQ